MILLFLAGIYDPESPEFGKYIKKSTTSKKPEEPKVVTSVSNITKQLEFKISGDADDGGDQDHVESPEDNEDN